MEIKRTASVCDSPNLTNCDRCVLSTLRLNLMEIESNLILSSIQSAIEQFKHVFDQKGLINLTVDGQVQFMTPRARELLDQYFLSQEPYTLPNSLKHWFKHQTLQHISRKNESFFCLPLHIEQAEHQLTIYLVSNAMHGQYLMVMEERKLQSLSTTALELLGLTKREAEALFWIAKDKSNSDIARILNCCEGTVRKHLENLYKKLGVQTRTGAIIVALEKLGILKA